MTTENEKMKVKLTNWRHSHGIIFAGTLRIAKEDFDTDPSGHFKKQMFDQICEAMNHPPSPHLELLRECRDWVESCVCSTRDAKNPLMKKLTAALSTVQESLTVEKEETCGWSITTVGFKSGCGVYSAGHTSPECFNCGKKIKVKDVA